MSLKIVCETCGSECFIKQIQDERKGFLLVYDCPKCNKINKEEWIEKVSW